MINNKTVFITGGTGSFGKKFVKKILKDHNPKKVIIYSRDELKQYEMRKDSFYKKYKKKLRFFIGDIRDRQRLNLSMKDVDTAIHAAALKQVDAAEYNPFEVVKTNIIGTENLISSAINNDVDKVLALSTDKASSPLNLYGATKLCSDKLIISGNNYTGNKKLKLSVIRYGNVMGSRGSVIPLFLKNKNIPKVRITDSEMTRFNITLEESVEFVLKCLDLMKGGELFVPKIPSYKLLDLVKAIYGNKKIIVTGTGPGEKIHEEMISINESQNTLEFKNMFVVLPRNLYKKRNFEINLKKKLGSFRYCKKNFTYSSDSNNNFLTPAKIKKIIDKNKIDIIF